MINIDAIAMLIVYRPLTLAARLTNETSHCYSALVIAAIQNTAAGFRFPKGAGQGTYMTAIPYPALSYAMLLSGVSDFICVMVAIFDE